jgi:hypothetical protein
MLNDFLNGYPLVAILLLLVGLVVTGYLEWRIFRRADIACVTWFFATLIASVYLVGSTQLGAFRWALGLAVFLSATTYLVRFYRINKR